MSSRRMLFVQGPAAGSLKPLYVAFVAIALLALTGFALAAWPRGPVVSDYRPLRDEAVPSVRGPEAVLPIPSRVRDAPGRTRRM